MWYFHLFTCGLAEVGLSRWPAGVRDPVTGNLTQKSNENFKGKFMPILCII